MAVILIPTPIYDRLQKSVKYATDKKKTTLQNAIDYAADPFKSENFEYTSCINCTSTDTAYQEMQETKALYGKKDRILGFRFIHSFKDFEATPEQTHEISVKLAERFFGKRYQVVIGTHLNEDHLHSHIVINSVSFVDGKKYDNKLAYLTQLREINDELCKQAGLSVLPQNSYTRSLTYKEWTEQKQGIPSRNDMIRKDIDAAIAASFSFREFNTAMGKLGYRVHYGQNVKYMTVTPPGEGTRARRVYRLGEDYSENAIRQRVERNRERQPLAALLISTRRRRASNAFPKHVPTKLTGIRALYYKYLYQLGAIRKQPYTSNRRTAYILRNEIGQMERYVEQFRLLNGNHISTLDELNTYRAETELKIEALLGQREAIYRKRRTVDGKSDLPALQAQCNAITAQLKPLRAQVKNCKEIEERSAHIAQQQIVLQQKEPIKAEQVLSKQEKQIER